MALCATERDGPLPLWQNWAPLTRRVLLLAGARCVSIVEFVLSIFVCPPRFSVTINAFFALVILYGGSAAILTIGLISATLRLIEGRLVKYKDFAYAEFAAVCTIGDHLPLVFTAGDKGLHVTVTSCLVCLKGYGLT